MIWLHYLFSKDIFVSGTYECLASVQKKKTFCLRNIETCCLGTSCHHKQISHAEVLRLVIFLGNIYCTFFEAQLKNQILIRCDQYVSKANSSYVLQWYTLELWQTLAVVLLKTLCKLFLIYKYFWSTLSHDFSTHLSLSHGSWLLLIFKKQKFVCYKKAHRQWQTYQPQQEC